MEDVCPSLFSTMALLKKKNRALVEMVRCLLQAKDPSIKFWLEQSTMQTIS